MLPATSSFNSAQQKSYKPLLVTGCIPRVENNRVRFLNGQTVAIGKYCSLYNAPSGSEFDASKFCVMSIVKMEKNDMSGDMEEVRFRFIADMDPKMYQQFIRAQQAAYRKTFEDALFTGQKVHLFSKNGIYKIISISSSRKTIRITCNKWQVEYERKERTEMHRDVDVEDIKCLAGGLHNAVFE